MGTIVLAPGIFGFGDLLPGFQSLVNYFNGVELYLGGFPRYLCRAWTRSGV